MAKFQNVVTGIVWELSDPYMIERCRTNLSYIELSDEDTLRGEDDGNL